MLCLLLSISIIQGSEASPTWQTKAENNLSDYFNNNDIDAELYLDGKVVKLREFQLDDPQNKIVILFNHGTRRWKESQECNLPPNWT